MTEQQNKNSNQSAANTHRFLLLGVSMLFVIGICLASLQYRALTLPKTSSNSLIPTDAVIVTTGGQARITAGLSLMQEGLAKHMLVTGVGDGITKTMLSSSLGLSETQKAQLFCCVDLDFTATDTIGNALASAKWMKHHNYVSLRLVTANYHLARAKLEFARTMPEIDITYYSVSPPDLRPHDWYHDWAIIRLLVRESGKYLAAHLRHFFSNKAPA